MIRCRWQGSARGLPQAVVGIHKYFYESVKCIRRPGALETPLRELRRGQKGIRQSALGQGKRLVQSLPSCSSSRERFVDVSRLFC